MRRFQVWIAAGVLTAVLVMPQPANAQGFSVNEHGSCAMGRGGTGVAAPCADGSAIFYNPAGLLLPEGQGMVSTGATVIAPTGDFTNSSTGLVSDLVKKATPVPAMYVAYGLSDVATIGLGVFAPYGLAIDWNPSTSQGRFLGYHSSVQGIYIQPTFGLKASDRLSFGIGFDVSTSSVELRQRVDLSTQTAAPGVTFANLGVASGTDFADVKLTGNDMALGFHLGIIAKVTDRLSVGLRYLSKQTVEIDNGQAVVTQIPTGLVLAAGNPLGLPAGTPVDAVVASQFQPGGLLVDQRGTASLPYPAQLSAGLALQLTDKVRLLGDVGIQYWSTWKTLPLNFSLLGNRTLVEAYRNTATWRLGGEYKVTSGTTARLGIIAHNAAAPDQTVTPNLPEGPRDEFTAGLGSHLTDRLGFDVAYQYIRQADRQGRSGDGGLAVPTAAVNDGLYTFKANLVGVTLTYSF